MKNLSLTISLVMNMIMIDFNRKIRNKMGKDIIIACYLFFVLLKLYNMSWPTLSLDIGISS